jgi:hypothetical protein
MIVADVAANFPDSSHHDLSNGGEGPDSISHGILALDLTNLVRLFQMLHGDLMKGEQGGLCGRSSVVPITSASHEPPRQGHRFSTISGNLQSSLRKNNSSRIFLGRKLIGRETKLPRRSQADSAARVP